MVQNEKEELALDSVSSPREKSKIVDNVNGSIANSIRQEFLAKKKQLQQTTLVSLEFGDSINYIKRNFKDELMYFTGSIERLWKKRRQGPENTWGHLRCIYRLLATIFRNCSFEIPIWHPIIEVVMKIRR